MRDRREFAEVVCKKVAEMMTDKDVSVNEKHVNNGGIQYQITIKGEEAVAPSITISEEEDVAVREAERIVNIYRTSDRVGVDASELMNAENLLKNSFVALVNAEKNRQSLESQDAVMFDYLDLLGVVRCSVPIGGYNGSFMVKNEILKAVGISKEEIIEAARKNTAEGVMFKSMTEIMIEMGMPAFMAENTDACPMIVGTNTRKYFGAAVMLYADKLAELADKYESDLYILPSSIHECILLTDVGGSPEELRSMVTEVNSTQVAEDERLSDSVYYFSRETGELKVA